MPVYDVNSQAAVEEFRQAAAAYGARVNKSPESARAALIGMGILTKSGKLSKNYNHT